MIPSIRQPKWLKALYSGYVALFFLYLVAPLVVVAVFAFNDSLFPSPPWQGFTLDWFFGTEEPKLGIFHDDAIMESIWISIFVAFWVTLLSVAVGTTNAFLFEREKFPFKDFFYILMLLPLVIPGIILGISILVFTNTVANWVEATFGFDIEALRPGLVLVILGQFSFIATITTLIIAARLRKFDRTLEEAALNLGATPITAVFTITIPYLAPAIIGAAIISFLMSFENFNTTLMLVGSDAPLTITMFDRLKEGSTPALNAVSLLLMTSSAVLALIYIAFQKKAPE